MVPDNEKPESGSQALSKEEREKIDAALADIFTLLKSYQDVAKKAAEGGIVTAEDFEGAEKRFNDSGHYEQFIKDARAGAAKAHTDPAMIQLGSGSVKSPIDNPYAIEKMRAFLKQPEAKRLFDQSVLDARFESQYLAHARREDTALSPETDTEEELIPDVLKNNPGFALGDYHTRPQALDFLIRHMQRLKENGVKTLYVEMAGEELQDVERLSVSELREFARTREHKGERLRTPEAWANGYGETATNPPDIPAKMYEMFAAAKEQGIRLVNVDKKGAARQLERDMNLMDHRIASTNFIWLSNIVKDQIAQGAGEGKAGKFVVLGGMGHFDSETRANGKTVNGYVDEALGVPFLSYARSDDSLKGRFVVGRDPKHADFFLAAGKDYPLESPDVFLPPAPTPVAKKEAKKNGR